MTISKIFRMALMSFLGTALTSFSAPFIGHADQLTDTKNQVINLYRSLLDRTDDEISADMAGINFWSKAILLGYSIGQIEEAIKTSDEYYVCQSRQWRVSRDSNAAG